MRCPSTASQSESRKAAERPASGCAAMARAPPRRCPAGAGRAGAAAKGGGEGKALLGVLQADPGRGHRCPRARTGGCRGRVRQCPGAAGRDRGQTTGAGSDAAGRAGGPPAAAGRPRAGGRGGTAPVRQGRGPTAPGQSAAIVFPILMPSRAVPKIRSCMKRKLIAVWATLARPASSQPGSRVQRPRAVKTAHCRRKVIATIPRYSPSCRPVTAASATRKSTTCSGRNARPARGDRTAERPPACPRRGRAPS